MVANTLVIVRGSPLIGEVVLGNRQIHSVYIVIRIHLCSDYKLDHVAWSLPGFHVICKKIVDS